MPCNCAQTRADLADALRRLQMTRAASIAARGAADMVRQGLSKVKRPPVIPKLTRRTR